MGCRLLAIQSEVALLHLYGCDRAHPVIVLFVGTCVGRCDELVFVRLRRIKLIMLVCLLQDKTKTRIYYAILDA
jgi:hypothetical protein